MALGGKQFHCKMSCDHELANEKTHCSGKNASYITKENTREYKRIQESTREYKRIQENTEEYNRIEENTSEYRRIQENSRE